MDASALAALLPEVEKAVLEAGEIIKTNWTKPSDIRRKGRIDLVTETDLAVEKALVASLRRVVPEAAVLGEETSPGLDPGRLCWIIDPVDGTTNFAHRVPFVATSVGLWCEGRVVLGVVNTPMLGELFCAALGGGAFVNGRPMRVSQAQRLEDALVATGFPYDAPERIEGLMADLEAVVLATQGLRRPGAAALDLAYVAAGRFDAFYETGLKPWDTAAGWLLVTEAGGRVTAYAPDQPFRLASPTLLASNGLLHEAVAGLLGA